MAYTTIDNPELYFQTKIYTGDGNTGRSITFDNTDTSMQPDFAWFKNRDDSDHFGLVDSVRGVTKRLSSNAVKVVEWVSSAVVWFDLINFVVPLTLSNSAWLYASLLALNQLQSGCIFSEPSKVIDLELPFPVYNFVWK